jgi:hypothetical protein
MPCEELKIAARAVETIKQRADLPVEITPVLETIIDAMRNIDGRLSVLEGKVRIQPTAEMGLPNRR